MAAPKTEEIRSAASIRAQDEADRNKLLALIAAGKKKEALKQQIQMAKDGSKGLLELPYKGKKVEDADEYKDAKKVTDSMMLQVLKLPKLSTGMLTQVIEFEDTDFVVQLYQAYEVAGVFNGDSDEMDPRLKAWFVLGFYSYIYELGGKMLLSYVNTFPKKKPHTDVGEAVDILKNRHKISDTPRYFDPFLRNSINHSQYIVTDFKSGKFESWNTPGGKMTPKREYEVMNVFTMTVRLLMFIVSYHVSYYGVIIKLDEEGKLVEKGIA